MYNKIKKTIYYYILPVMVCLCLSMNSIAWTLPTYHDTLRPVASIENVAEELEEAVSLGPAKASSAGTFSSAATGLFEKINVRSITMPQEYDEGDLYSGNIKVEMNVKRIKQETEKVVLYCRWRGSIETIRGLVNYAKTGKRDIDDALEKFLEGNLKQNIPGLGIFDLIIENAEFEKNSLLTVSDIARIGIGSIRIGDERKAFRALHETISDNGMARFVALAHMAYDKGLLSQETIWKHLTEDGIKYYRDRVRSIGMATGGRVADSVKFSCLLEALCRNENIFGDKNKILIKDIEALRRKKENSALYDYISSTKTAERKVTLSESPGRRKQAAEGWHNATLRYLRLNLFDKAVFCKRKEAHNWFLAYVGYYKEAKRERDESKTYNNLQEAVSCLLKALKLNKELRNQQNIIKDISSLGECYFRLRDYEKSAKYYKEAAERGQAYHNPRLSRFARKEALKGASMNWGRAALSYAILNKFTEAGKCDTMSALLCQKRGENDLAIEHYIYAAKNFERAFMDEEKETCMQNARKIDKELFERIDAVVKMSNNAKLNREAVDILARLPDLLTLAGRRPATSGFITNGTIGPDEDIENIIGEVSNILETCFHGNIGLIYRTVSRSSTEDEKDVAWYCIYDKKKIRAIIADSKDDIFKKIRFNKIDTDDDELNRFMDRIMNKNSSELIFLGYPKADVENFIEYQSFLKDARIPLKEALSIDEARLLRVKIHYKHDSDAVLFIDNYYKAIQDYNTDSKRLRRKIGFDWISSRSEQTKSKYAVRYVALAAIFKMLIEGKSLERTGATVAFPDYENIDLGTDGGASRSHSITDEGKIAQAIASQA
ncbi:MAG: hypothetical protein ABH843_06150 [Candidatus Omnitrophota bacterium]